MFSWTWRSQGKHERPERGFEPVAVVSRQLVTGAGRGDYECAWVQRATIINYWPEWPISKLPCLFLIIPLFDRQLNHENVYPRDLGWPTLVHGGFLRVSDSMNCKLMFWRPHGTSLMCA
jgi:hypothetical protein